MMKNCIWLDQCEAMGVKACCQFCAYFDNTLGYLQMSDDEIADLDIDYINFSSYYREYQTYIKDS